MNAARKTARSVVTRSVASSALAAALLAGCTTASTVDSIASASTEQGSSARDADRGVSHAEKDALKSPGDAALRVSLGQAYMKAGRFESAINAFNDAIQLGDESPRTALSLTLANIAIGRNDEAVTILDDWREDLPAADLGLAYALAGEAQRGTAILADAVRAGDSTAQARQNFAYALALDGRWREARIMMSQDLAADMVNDRLGKWAALSTQADPRLRIAVMLGTPMRADAGQPVQLALAAPVAAPQLAVETYADALAPESEPAPVEQWPVPNAMLADVAPVVAPTTVAPPPMLAAAEAAVDEAPVASEQFAIAITQPSFISAPVVQQVPVSLAKEPRAVSAQIKRADRKPEASWPVANHGTHLVQLGSFTSEQSARRAWDVYTARNRALRNYRMTIIPATVNGTAYWRVAAAGFDAGTARNMCGSIKSRGGACLTYANPDVTAPGERGGPQMARRR